MAIGEKFKEFREDVLQIRQREAAALLGIDPAALSNYELGKRDFPYDLLVKAKDVFAMTDEQYLAMLLGRPYGQGRKDAVRLSAETNEARARYYSRFTEAYGDVIRESPELRELIVLLAAQEPGVRREMLHLVKGMAEMFKKMNPDG
ncbi:helix-turn-helix domain-containing protein [Bhargavaea cecembensis]|uniref:helix-turn-helix domain-containing protein n=1 Tax=Bhargavaea cecembensis TaxID=394098 RepID=UPI00058E9D0C|nr:helix-turn-helix transcriptional regulator [Bhargavaea cecembensis]